MQRLHWKKHYESFEDGAYRRGKQGAVIRLKQKNTQQIFMCKVSRYEDYCARREHIVASCLKKEVSFCPHFMTSVEIVDTEGMRKECKFKERSSEGVIVNYIPRAHSFSSVVNDKNVHDDAIFGVLKQVLGAISMAYNAAKFTHYDLHSGNIILTHDPKKFDLVRLYILPSGEAIPVPTYGYHPVIIDFGYGYVRDMEGKKNVSNIYHSQYGFTGDVSDPVVDMKLFLLTTSHHLVSSRRRRRTEYLRSFVLDIFHSLSVCNVTGWNQEFKDSCLSRVADILVKMDPGEKALTYATETEAVVELILGTGKIPFSNYANYTDDNSLGEALGDFLSEWEKIESQSSKPYDNLFFLRVICDSVWMDVKKFKVAVLKAIDTRIGLFLTSHINFGTLGNSIRSLGGHLSKLVHEISTGRNSQAMYKKLKYKDAGEVLSELNSSMMDEVYEYSENTIVEVIDYKNKSQSTLSHSVECNIAGAKNYKKDQVGKYLQTLLMD